MLYGIGMEENVFNVDQMKILSLTISYPIQEVGQIHTEIFNFYVRVAIDLKVIK